jgi:hypothetical protein
METYLNALGYAIWILVVNGYTPLATHSIDHEGKRASGYNANTKNAILCGLLELEFLNVMH